MSNPEKPSKPQAEDTNAINLQSKKKRQAYLEDLKNLSQAANARAKEISETAERVKSEHANFVKDINEFNKASGEANAKITAEVQNCQKLTEAIKSTKVNADKYTDEIYEFHQELFGDDEGGENGGLKHDLEKAYQETQDKLKTLQEAFELLRKEKTEEFSNVLQEHTRQFEGVREKIESLLPGALSAGLSSAFQMKREAIEKSQRNHYIGFFVSVAILVLIFGITFWVSMEMTSFDVFFFVICRNMLFASPVLWLAIFFNRRLNLDTRLIEEYTHKETVSKTFEGLSKEIQNIEEDLANELQIQLLQATMDVNTTNPGKLVKGYDAIDHPVTEMAPAIDALSSLFKEINSLKKLPGFNLPSVLSVIALAFSQNQSTPLPDSREESESTM